MKSKLSLFGGIGTGVVALCCFTPILVIAVTAVGFAGIIAYLDYILFPLLAFFILLTGYGLYLSKQPKESCAIKPIEKA